MNTETQTITNLEQVMAGLKSESLETIDFDALAVTLDDMHRAIDGKSVLHTELALIKKEYRNRILGMLKAMLACRHDPEDAETAALLTQDNNEYDAAKLIALYARTAARFRACFPGSFKYALPRHENGTERWKEHKL